MKLAYPYLITFFCFILAACSSSDKDSQPAAEPAALKHLQQDQITEIDSQADNFFVSLIPEPVISAEPAEVIITGCRETMGITWLVNGTIISEASSTQLKSDHFKRDDDITVRITCGKETTEVNERVQNSAPKISAVKFKDPRIISNSPIEVIPEAEDVDGDPIEYVYQWTVNGVYLGTVTGPVLPADYVVKNNEILLEVIPSDESSDGDIFPGTVFTVPNATPSIDSQPPQSFSGNQYQYQLKVSDADADPISYSLLKAPEGMQISESGLITWPLENISSGEYDVEVVIEDPDGAQSRQEFTITLSLPE